MTTSRALKQTGCPKGTVHHQNCILFLFPVVLLIHPDSFDVTCSVSEALGESVAVPPTHTKTTSEKYGLLGFSAVSEKPSSGGKTRWKYLRTQNFPQSFGRQQQKVWICSVSLLNWGFELTGDQLTSVCYGNISSVNCSLLLDSSLLPSLVLCVCACAAPLCSDMFLFTAPIVLHHLLLVQVWNDVWGTVMLDVIVVVPYVRYVKQSLIFHFKFKWI